MDSPRGRIYLMNGVTEHQIPLNSTIGQHFDTCLGCLACVTACPSGVKYDQLIGSTRPQVERNLPRTGPEQWLRRLIYSLLPYPQRLRLLLGPVVLYQKTGLQRLLRSLKIWDNIAPQLAALESLLPPHLSPQAFETHWPRTIPAQGTRRYRVGLILGCVQRLFNPAVNQATIQVLTANGCEVVIPPGQGCCGALSHHQGQEQQAQSLARQMIDSFSGEELDAVIINASGCGHTLKEYGQILAEDPIYGPKAEQFVPKVKDVQEFLVDVGLTAPLAPLQESPLTVVYQDACHMLHGQRISLQPRQLLRQIPGVRLREPIDAALCCGSAGIYNILQPQVSAELGRQKAKNLLDTDAQVIVSANIGCFVQISKHLRLEGNNVPVFHPMELLDRSIRGLKLELDN
jgi:glycolate oxidase iron-sulfur subunit